MRVAVATVVASALVLVASSAGAQRRPPHGQGAHHAEAREHFFSATQLYEQGNLEGAIAEFRAADAIESIPVAHFDVAQCLKGLFRYAEAIDEYRRYLSAGGTELSADRRAAVQVSIEQLEALVAPVTLQITPDEADVRIDGRSVGTSPLSGPLVLAAGRRVIEVVADGYVTLRDELEVVARTPRTVRIRLPQQETAATLRVRSAPPGAQIRIDGLDVGLAPIERRVTSGGHVIEASASSFEQYRAPVTLAARQTLDFLATLEHTHDPPIWDQWWFWAGVSAVAVTTIVLLVLLVPEQRNDPVQGNVPPGIVQALTAF